MSRRTVSALSCQVSISPTQTTFTVAADPYLQYEFVTLLWKTFSPDDTFSQTLRGHRRKAMAAPTLLQLLVPLGRRASIQFLPHSLSPYGYEGKGKDPTEISL